MSAETFSVVWPGQAIKLPFQFEEVSLFFLNLWKHPNYMKNMPLFNEYMSNFKDYIRTYLAVRYGVTGPRVESYYPYFVPKSYDEVQAYDSTDWRQQYFGRTFLQVYFGFGLQLKPHPELKSDPAQADFVGYCELDPDLEKCAFQPKSMLYVDMPTYDDHSNFFKNNIYKQFEQFACSATHELDHEMLGLTCYPGWVTDVHRARGLPHLEWKSNAISKVYPSIPVTFFSQPDARTLLL